MNQPQHDDELASLLKAAASGDAHAFENFYTATVYDAIAVLREEGADPLEAMLLECYLQVWRTASQFDPERMSALGWLHELLRTCVRGAASPVEVPK